MELERNKSLSCIVLFAVMAAFIGAGQVTAQPDSPEVQLKVTGTHLHVPVFSHRSKAANSKNRIHLAIYGGDRLVQDFKVTLPRMGEPYWIATYPLAHFDLQGRTVTIKKVRDPKERAESKAKPAVWKWAMEKITTGDDLPGERAADYARPYRNQFHASARRGWNNDGNGMVYHDGKYHLYFQHNPFGIYWGNMHWGHFESVDMIHWKERPIALYQKTQRDMMFSGGGFVDINNSSGLGKGTQFVAFTSTGRGECLAYSKDGGITFTELAGNPVVPHDGRDPKILWYEPQQKWVMVVYNMEECDETKALPMAGTFKREYSNFTFYESKDLRRWKRTGAFTHPDRGAVFECPELFKLKVGSGSRWITFGAQGRYFIGDFNGKTFVRESGPHGDMSGPYSAQGAFYAAQNFSNMPDGRIVRIGWIRTTEVYAKRFPGQRVSQALTLPHELQLRRTDQGLRLACVPVEEAKKLRVEKLNSLEDCRGELTEVIIEFEEDEEHELVINGIDASFEGKSARIFTDHTINEVYANDGLFYQVRERKADSFDSTETVVKSGKVKSLKVYRLKSIWN